MLPSDAPTHRRIFCSSRPYAAASSAEWMSGSVTISANGTPARLKSMSECVDPMSDAAPWWFIFALSSSMCSRSMRTTAPLGSVMLPRAATGSSYLWGETG